MEIIEVAALIAGILAILAWVSSTITALTVRRIYAQIGPLLADVTAARAALGEVRTLIAEARPALALVAEVRPLIAEARPLFEKISQIADNPTEFLLAGLDAEMGDPEAKGLLEQRLQWAGRNAAKGAVAYIREQAAKAQAEGGGQTPTGGILGALIQGLIPKQYRGLLGMFGGGGGGGGGTAAPSQPAEDGLTAAQRYRLRHG